MIISARQVEVFAHAAPVDMRKSFDTLAALVKQELGQNLLSGSLFLFTSKDRKRAKVLYFDGTGLCLFAKRLDKGRCARRSQSRTFVKADAERADAVHRGQRADRPQPCAAHLGRPGAALASAREKVSFRCPVSSRSRH